MCNVAYHSDPLNLEAAHKNNKAGVRPRPTTARVLALQCPYPWYSAAGARRMQLFLAQHSHQAEHCHTAMVPITPDSALSLRRKCDFGRYPVVWHTHQSGETVHRNASKPLQPAVGGWPVDALHPIENPLVVLDLHLSVCVQNRSDHRLVLNRVSHLR